MKGEADSGDGGWSSVTHDSRSQDAVEPPYVEPNSARDEEPDYEMKVDETTLLQLFGRGDSNSRGDDSQNPLNRQPAT